MTTANKQENGPKTRQPEREPIIEAEIGHRLKAYYADILSRPIPDRLLHALKPAQEPGSVGGGVLRGSIEAESPPRISRRNAA